MEMDKHFPNLSNVQLPKKSFTPMPDHHSTSMITISEAAGRLGVSHKTMRRWEKYGLVHPIRNPQNQRLYYTAEIDNLVNRKYKPLPENSIAPQNYHSISVAADEIGVSVKTLRRWDSEGKINLPRDNNNRRIFTRETITQLKNNRPESSAPAPAPISLPAPENSPTQVAAVAKLPVKPSSNPSPHLPPLVTALIAPFLSLLPFILVALPLILFALLGYKPSVPLQSVSFSPHPSPLPLGISPLEPGTATDSAVARDNPIFQNLPRGEVAGITVTGGSLLSFESILDNNYNFGVAGTVEGNQLISTTTVKPPLVISSREKVANLNAELLDGHSWDDITKAAAAATPLQAAYNTGNTITTSGKDITFNLIGSDKFSIEGFGDVRISTTGKTVVSGAVEMNTGLSIKGGSLSIGADRFTVASTTGNTNIAGTLSVTGIITSSTLQSAGNLILQANNNATRYIYLQTNNNNPSLFFAGISGTNDPGLRVNNATGQIEYRDQNDTTWVTLDSLAGGGGGVTSITGTANQISASASTGAVTLSLPSDLRIPGTLTAASGTLSMGGAGHNYFAGNVGIGTTNPAYQLHIVGDLNVTGQYRINGSQISTTNILEGVHLYYTDARARNALSVIAPITYDSTTGLFGVDQATTTTDGYLSAADWTTFNSKESPLTFSSGLTRTVDTVALGGTLGAATEINLNSHHFAFTGTGNVGIGTTDTGAKLHVKTTTNSNHDALILEGGNTGSSYIGILFKHSGSPYDAARIAATSANEVGGGRALAFYTPNGAGQPLIERMRLNTSGNVGIGTTAPTKPLEVNGEIMASTGVIRASQGTGTNYQFVMNAAHGSGPRLQLGSIGAGDGGYFELGAWNNINNFDSKSRDLHFFNSGGLLYLTNNSGHIGIGTTEPSQKLHIEAGGIRLGSTSNANNVLDTIAQASPASGSLYWGNSALLTEASLGSYGVSSITGTVNQIITSGSSGAVTLSLPQNIHTSATPAFAGLSLTDLSEISEDYQILAVDTLTGTVSTVNFPVSGSSSLYWSLTGEQLHPQNALAHDLLIGGTSTASATIALQANTGHLKAVSSDIGSLSLSGTTIGLNSDTDLLSLSASALQINGTLTVASSITGPTIGTINNININAGAVSNVSSLALATAGNTWADSGDMTASGNLTANHLLIRDTDATNTLMFRWNENDSANRILDIFVGGGNRQLALNQNFTVGGTSAGIIAYTTASSLTVSGDSHINQNLTTSASPAFTGLSLTDTSSRIDNNRVLTLDATTGLLAYLDTSGWDKDSSNDLTTTTLFAGDVSGVWNDLQLGEGVVGTSEMADGSVTGLKLATSGIPVEGYILQTDVNGNLAWADPLALADSVNFWTQTGQQIHAKNALWHDLVIGGTSTASATIALQANTGDAHFSGNVGIGTTAPSQKLDILGAIRLGINGGANDILNTSAAADAASGSLYWGNSALITEASLGSYGVSSLTGTANQISASAATGAVTLSLPSDLRAPGTFNAVTSIATGAEAGTVRLDASGNLTNIGTYQSSGNITSSGGVLSMGGTGNNYFAGNVGIGTTNPLYTLEVTGTGYYSSVLSLGTQATTTAHAVRADRAISTGNGLAGGGNLTSDLTLSINSATCSGTDKLQWTGTAFICSADVDTNNYATGLSFSGTATKTLTLTQAGLADLTADFTDIGFDNPMSEQGDLIIGGALGAPARLTGSSVNGYVLKYNTATNLPYWAQDIDTTYTAGSGLTLTDTSFSLGGSLASAITLDLNSHHFSFTGTGNVGIGTTAPSQKLDILGAIRLGINGGANDILNTSAAADAASGSLYWGNSALITEASLGSYGVSSLTGTANQISASAATGAVTLSLPSDLRAPGTFNAVTSIATGAEAGTVRLDASGNLTNIGTYQSSGNITSSGGVLSMGGTGNNYFAGNVGIGTTAPGAKLQINADVSAKGLIIKANATTPGNLTEWQNSSANVLASISGDGRWGIGASPQNLIKFYVHSANLDPSGTSEGVHTQLVNSYTSSNTSQSRVNANYLYLNANSGSTLSGVQATYHGALYIDDANQGTISNAFGNYFYSAQETGSSGSVTNMNLFYATNYAQGVNTVSYDNWRAYSVDNISSALFNGATVTNAFGLNIGNITAGATNNYSIYTNTGLVRLGDNLVMDGTVPTITTFSNKDLVLSPHGSGQVGIGTTAPSELLEVRKDQNLNTFVQVVNMTNDALAGAGFKMVSATSTGFFGATPANYVWPHLADRIGFIADTDAGGLDFAARAATGDIRFFTGGIDTTNERLRITSAGDIGIGTTNPSQKLHLEAGGIRLGTTSNANNVLDTLAQAGAPSGSLYWGDRQLVDSTNISNFGVASLTGTTNQISASAATGAITLSLPADLRAPGSFNTVLGVYTGTENDGAGTLRIDAAGALQNITTLNMSGILTNTSATTNALNLTGHAAGITFGGTGVNQIITGANNDLALMPAGTGKIGIGTTAPTSALTIYMDNTTTLSPGIMIEQAGTGNATITFYKAGQSNWSVGTHISDNNKFKISSGLDLANNNALTIDTALNVGIGTTAPTALLDVSGTFKVNNLGQVTAGSWEANIVTAQYGGTGANLSSAAQYGLPYFSTTGILGGVLSPGTEGYVLTSKGAGNALSWEPVAQMSAIQWQLNNEQLSPVNAHWHDVMIGGTATSSAQIALQANTGNVTANNIFIRDTDASNTLHLKWNDNDTSDRTLNLSLSSADRYLTLTRSLTIGGTQDATINFDSASTLTVTGNSTINQNVSTTGLPTFAGAYFTGNVGIGTTDPGAKLHLLGPMRMTTVKIRIENIGTSTGAAAALEVKNDLGARGLIHSRRQRCQHHYLCRLRQPGWPHY
jgi:DNA-binding transcriptional MerR regulator/DUF4097 and DUF4098 domain-containing protein YvlB